MRTTFKGGSKYTGRTETKLVRSIWFPTEISRILDWIESARDYLENFQPESRQHNTGIPANRAGSALSFIARFYALPLDLTEFSKPPPPPNPHTQNLCLPTPKHLNTLFSKLNGLSLIHFLSIQILSKIAERQS